MTEPLAPLVGALPEGVGWIELPTPFPVGPVNCYVLADHPTTVVDPGMVWADTPERVTDSLAAAGLRPGDVEQIVVTHAHPDHFGAAGWLAEASGAPVICGRPEIPKIAQRWFGTGPNDPLGPLVGALGLPAELQGAFSGFHSSVADLTAAIDEVRMLPVEDGAILEAGGRSWQVQLTPGHAAGHISLFDAESGTLVAGDHLLARITPNPVIEADPDSPLGRRRSLVEYLESLDRFVALDPTVVLGGHGPAFTDTAQWAAAVRRHHDRRAEEILDVVTRHGPVTAFELSRHLFPRLEGFSNLLGISEAIGHVDLLADLGAVVSDGGLPVRYSAT